MKPYDLSKCPCQWAGQGDCNDCNGYKRWKHFNSTSGVIYDLMQLAHDLDHDCSCSTCEEVAAIRHRHLITHPF